MNSYSNLGVQAVLGTRCFRSLYKFRRTGASGLVTLLMIHVLAIGLADCIGLVTTVTYRILSVCPTSDSDALQIEQLHDWASKFHGLNVLSTSALAYVGLSTDAILVDLPFVSALIRNVLMDMFLAQTWRCWQIWKYTLYTNPVLIIMFPILILIASIGRSLRSHLNQVLLSIQLILALRLKRCLLCL